MIISCPACAKRYLIADGTIAPEGRRVRCAACGNAWYQDAAAPEAAPVPVPTPQPEAARPPVAPPMWQEEEARPTPMPAPEPPPPPVQHHEQRRGPRKKGRRNPAHRWNMLAVAASIALSTLVLLAKPGGIAGYDPFALLGPVQPNVLRLSVDAPVIGPGIDGAAVLTLFGRMRNPSASTQPVPALNVEVRDESGLILARWTSPPPVPTIGAGMTLTFETAANGIPETARTARLAFAAPTELHR